jgi:hypothetical protein
MWDGKKNQIISKEWQLLNATRIESGEEGK